MARHRKYTLNELPEPGTVFAVPLADGRVGVCRVLQRALQDVPRALVAASDWIADKPPSLDDSAVRKNLVLSHHNWAGQRELVWVSEPPPTEFRKLGRIPVLPEDVKAQCGSFGGWACGIQVLAQWRWDHDRNAVLAEDAQRQRLESAKQVESSRQRIQYLRTLSLADLLAKDLFPDWEDYPPSTAREGCRKIIRSFIRDVQAAKTPLTRTDVSRELRKCVEKLNRFDATHNHFIETIEREDLCAALEEVLCVAKFPDLTKRIEDWRDW
jgi:hypothetical protein